MSADAAEPGGSPHGSREETPALDEDYDRYWDELKLTTVAAHAEDVRRGRPWQSHRDPALPGVLLASLLADRRRDATSGLLLGLGSLAQRFFLPALFLEANQGAREMGLETQRSLAALQPSQPGVVWHFSGSVAEGLVLGAYTERSGEMGKADGPAMPTAYWNVPDIDVMRELKSFPVALQPTRGGLYMDRSLASHAGYTRVAFVEEKEQEPGTPADVGDAEKVVYLSSAMDEVHGDVGEWNASSRLWDACRTGPAFNVNWNNTISITPEHAAVADLNIDMVSALPLTEMLPEVRAWLHRVSVDGVEWPPEVTREEIRQHGRCFLVGTGHPSSERRDLEWRMSFSDLERRLAHTLSHTQRKIYMTIKAIQKCYLQKPKVLCTYHIKTVMFWEVETSTASDWAEENLFQRTLSMLDRLQCCLEQHFLPSYFMPENNLISRATAADVTQVLTALRRVRRQPLRHIYGIDDRLRFRFSTAAPLSGPLGALLSAVERGDTRTVPETLAVGLLRLVPALAGRHQQPVPRLCARLLRDAWGVLRPETGRHPVCDHWATFAAVAVQTDLQDDAGIAVMEALWKEFAEDEEGSGALSETERKVLASPVEEACRPGRADERMHAMQDLMFGDAAKQVSPISRFLVLHHAGLKMIRDVKEQPDVDRYPPLRSAAIRTQLKLVIVDYVMQNELNGDAEKGTNIVTKLAKSLINQNMDHGNDPQTSDSDDLQQVLQDAGVSSEQTDQLMARYNALCQKINEGELCENASEHSDSDGPPFETSPLIVQVTPLYNLGTYIALINGGLSETETRHRHAPFFAMAAFLRKHRLAEAAAGLHLRMHRVQHYSSKQEMERVIFDLNSGPLYLSTLPEPVRQLMRLTSCRALLGAAYIFNAFVDWLLAPELELRDAELRPGELHPSQLRRFDQLTEPSARLPADVVLTQLVMRLCVQHGVGGDTADCLRRVGAAAGPEVCRRARRTLRRWRVASACSPCACMLL